MEYLPRPASRWSGSSANTAARLITGVRPRSDVPNELLLARAGLPSLESRRSVEQCTFAYKFVHGSERIPFHITNTFSDWLSLKSVRASSLRNADTLKLPRAKKSALRRSPLYLALEKWNSLPSAARLAPSLSSLRSCLSF